MTFQDGFILKKDVGSFIGRGLIEYFVSRKEAINLTTKLKQVKRIGITGQSGFIGSHLYNFLSLKKEVFELVPFEDSFFENKDILQDFVAKCDVIVHLAGVNRDPDPQNVYDGNVRLAEDLIYALEATKSNPYVLFSSSSQEENDNLYGKGKKKARELLTKWASGAKALFTGLIIPNVFGPFGKPFYNSVVATFCHQLSHNDSPQINVDASLKLIYVQELVAEIIKLIDNPGRETVYEVPYTSEKKVTEILAELTKFKDSYLESGLFPKLESSFDINLFNTFRCYFDHGNLFPRKFKQNTDQRGSFVELIKSELGGQVSFSTTAPGIMRGNHYHTRKIERFAVIKGEALIQLRRIGTNEVFDFYLSGKEPAYVDMPIWYTHNIKNTGKEELYTIFWINEFYDPDDADTYFETV